MFILYCGLSVCGLTLESHCGGRVPLGFEPLWGFWFGIAAVILCKDPVAFDCSPSPKRTLCVWTQSLHHVRLSVTPWAVAPQAPLSMGFSRQEYCSGLLFPPPGDLPHPRIEAPSLASSALAGRFFTTAQPVKLQRTLYPIKSCVSEKTLTKNPPDSNPLGGPSTSFCNDLLSQGRWEIMHESKHIHHM